MRPCQPSVQIWILVGGNLDWLTQSANPYPTCMDMDNPLGAHEVHVIKGLKGQISLSNHI
jgi:hypothetical protein